MAKITRIPVVVPLTTREIANQANSYLTDSALVNCMVETSQDKKRYAIRRPGLNPFINYGSNLQGQGLFFYKSTLFAIQNNTLYNIAGGSSYGADGTAWTLGTAPIWPAREWLGSCVFNNQVFIFGGESTGAKLLNDVWSSPDMVNWTQVASAAPWSQTTRIVTVVLGGLIYLFPDGTGQVWSSPDGANWSLVTGTGPWIANTGFNVVAFGTGMYFMGGHDGSGYRNTVYYSPDGSNWSTLQQLATFPVRAFFALLSFKGKMWVLGGNNGGDINSVYSSVDGQTWVSTGTLPANRSDAAACVYSGKMWIVGGYNGAATTTVYSTPDGIAFTTVTGAYGGTAITAAALIPFRTPPSVGSNGALAMWLIGGLLGGATFTNQIYYSTPNVNFPASISITTPGASTEQFQTDTQRLGDYLIIKNNESAFVLSQGSFTQITDQNYPLLTVPGVVNLDDTIYVMDPNGVIYGSNLSDPFHWSALNFITADFTSDTGVMLVRYLQYVLALKSTSMQFFYDAGIFPGSPLLPIPNYNLKIGCSSAGSVVRMNNTVVFMANSATAGRYIAVLNGNLPQSVSNPDVNRILNSWDALSPVYSWGSRINGHDIYVLSVRASSPFFVRFTLMYDFTENHWGIWTNPDGTDIYDGINYATDTVADYVQSLKTGIIYLIDPNYYLDNLSTFTATGYLDKVDGGTIKRKFGTAITAIGDQTPIASGANPLQISWSNDDGQTYNTASALSVDLTSQRPRLPRQGSFFRRRYRFDHATNNRLRLEALELELDD